MIEPQAWQAFGGTAAVVILLGGLALALQRLGVLRGPATGAPAKDDERIARLESEFTELRICLAENYVRRDDYVTGESRVIGHLEAHSVMLARLEERLGSQA